MIALLRRCLILEQGSPLCKSHLSSLSLSFRHFSSSTKLSWKEVVDVDALRDLMVKKHRFDLELASKVVAQLVQFRSPERADSMLSFLQENCFSDVQMQRIAMQNPRILTASAEDDVKLKINIFKDFGFPPEDIAKIITGSVSILNMSSEKKIVPQLSRLKSLMGSNDEVVKLVKRCGWYMNVDLEKTLVPNHQLLKSSGVNKEGIDILLYHYPRCLLVKPDEMRKSVEKVSEIWVDPSSNSFVYAIGVVTTVSEETWELKLQGFKDMGFSESQVLQITRSAPLVLNASTEKVKAIKELLIATGRFDLSDMIKNPMTFTCSIEMRYKPRIRVLEILESKKIIEQWPRLRTICMMREDVFFEKFVRPYPDLVGEVYNPKGCVKKGKN